MDDPVNDPSEASADQASGLDGEQDPIEPDVDRAQLDAAVAAAGDDAAYQTELIRLNRATGHIPGIQKRLDAIERATGRVDAVEASTKALVARFDTLLDSLPESFIPERVLASMRPESSDSNRELLDKIAELQEQITGKAAEEPELETPEAVALRAQWNVATQSVAAYAIRQSVDPDGISDAVWARAFDANKDDPSAAALAVMRYVDEQKAAAARRDEKTDAGTGGADASRGTRKGPLTVAQMKTMTRAELQAIPSTERMAALAAAG